MSGDSSTLRPVAEIILGGEQYEIAQNGDGINPGAYRLLRVTTDEYGRPAAFPARDIDRSFLVTALAEATQERDSMYAPLSPENPAADLHRHIEKLSPVQRDKLRIMLRAEVRGEKDPGPEGCEVLQEERLRVAEERAAQLDRELFQATRRYLAAEDALATAAIREAELERDLEAVTKERAREKGRLRRLYDIARRLTFGEADLGFQSALADFNRWGNKVEPLSGGYHVHSQGGPPAADEDEGA